MNINCQIPKNLLDKLKNISINSDKEVCGFIINNEKFLQRNNIHPDPQNYFLISPDSCVWGHDVILFHSHPKSCADNGFSSWDLENQFYFQLKMLLYSVNNDRFYFKNI